MEVDLTRFHKEVAAPFSGQLFIIRRVRFKEFVTQVGGLPLPINATVQATLDQLREKMTDGSDPGIEDRITRFYISKGAVTPPVWVGALEECPAGAICYDDLGSDADFLAGEIIQYSNEVASLKGMDKFFRGTGSRVAGPDEQEVRAAPLDAVAAGDV